MFTVCFQGNLELFGVTVCDMDYLYLRASWLYKISNDM